VSRGDDVLVWHAYMTCGNTVALLSSASHYRAMSSNERALIGRANRWLHWGDILGFKQMGLECFDWGGLFEDESVPEHAGINNFKYEFGGRRERTYTGTYPLTARGGLFLAARNALERLQALFPLKKTG
jgi:lipid II:glycine glycyltransferase (peptidoglycan interpeptide bridge formation enzyme)